MNHESRCGYQSCAGCQSLPQSASRDAWPPTASILTMVSSLPFSLSLSQTHTQTSTLKWLSIAASERIARRMAANRLDSNDGLLSLSNLSMSPSLTHTHTHKYSLSLFLTPTQTHELCGLSIAASERIARRMAANRLDFNDGLLSLSRTHTQKQSLTVSLPLSV